MSTARRNLKEAVGKPLRCTPSVWPDEQEPHIRLGNTGKSARKDEAQKVAGSTGRCGRQMMGSELAASRVMKSVTKFLEQKLGLKVNVTKSKVGRPKDIKYLGFGYYYDTTAKSYKAKPHAKSIAKFRATAKELTRRSWGVSNKYKIFKLNQLIRGWINYFKIGSMKGLCQKMDSHIRYRLRMPDLPLKTLD